MNPSLGNPNVESVQKWECVDLQKIIFKLSEPFMAASVCLEMPMFYHFTD